MPLFNNQPLSISAKTVILFSLFMCLLSLSITSFIWSSIYKNTNNHLKEDINKSEEIIRQTLLFSQEKFFSSAQVLSNDFGFKHAIASNDKSTIDSVLESHSKRINASIINIINLNGHSIASSKRKNAFVIEKSLIERIINEDGISQTIEINGKIYQGIFIPIKTPQISSIALICNEINKEYISKIKKLTRLDITIESKKNNNSILISTLNNEDLTHIFSHENYNDKGINKKDHFFTKSVIISNDNTQLKAYLTQNINEELNYLNSLKIKIALITTIILSIAIVSVAFLTRRIISPLTKLSKTAKMIAEDKYIQLDEININSNTREISALVSSFNDMLRNIKSREKKIRFQAENDLPTGLKNRASFLNLISYFYDNNIKVKILALKTADIATISDTFGYTTGDQYIKSIVSRIKNVSSICARLSTSQMVFTLSENCTEDDIKKVQKKITEILRIDQVKIKPHIFFTVLDLPKDCPKPKDILKKINIGLNAASTNASKFACYTAKIEEEHTQKLTILEKLRTALSDAQHEFNMVYQPKISSCSDKVHVEALLRWNNNQLGFVPPDLFIPLAEKAGFISDITYIVIEHVIKDIAIWKRQNIHQKVAVNLSVHDIDNIYLLPWILTQLEEHALPASSLSFEIIESELMKDPVTAAKQLNLYREAGFDLAIDDFGTGYSSLAYLKNMPITELKIDKSFVLKLANEIDDQHIVQTIIYLAKSLHLETVAEGVEDEASLEMLKRFGCDWIQGYFISRPLNFDDYTKWYINQSQGEQSKSSRLSQQ